MCSKWQRAKGQEKHVLQPKRSCRRKSHQNAVLVIANRSVFISGSGNCIDRDASRDSIAEIVGLTTRSVYRALKQEAAPPMLRRARSSSVVDPYLPYLASRWNQGCHNTTLLYKEIVTASDTRVRSAPFAGSFRHFAKQENTLSQNRQSSWTNPLLLARVALMIVRPTKNRTAEQTAYLERLIQSDATVAVVFTLAQDFGRRLAQTRRGVAVRAMESCRPS